MGGLNRISLNGFGSTMFDANVAALELMGVSVLGLGIVAGMELVAGAGLVVTVNAGTLCGRKVQNFTATTWTAPSSQTSYVWRDDDGNFTATTTADHPGGNLVCLGNVVAGPSSVAGITTENRMECWGWDDPFTLSIGGGLLSIDLKNQVVRQKSVRGHGGPTAIFWSKITGTKPDADYAPSATELEGQVIELAWTGWTASHNVILPSVTAVYEILNSTGQVATLKAATGTGIAIANGKAARIGWDGTNMRRLGPDT